MGFRAAGWLAGYGVYNYLDYVRNPDNGYLSTTIRPSKAMEFTVKVK